MTSKETAEQIRAELDAELDTSHSESDRSTIVATALTQESGEWRVIVYVLEGANLPAPLRELVDSRRDDIDVVASTSFTPE